VRKLNEGRITGGSNPTMYIVRVEYPTTLAEPYNVECNDVMEALELTPAEANIFKAIWRRGQARRGLAKPGAGGLYDAEKIDFFAKRVLLFARIDADAPLEREEKPSV